MHFFKELMETEVDLLLMGRGVNPKLIISPLAFLPDNFISNGNKIFRPAYKLKPTLFEK